VVVPSFQQLVSLRGDLPILLRGVEKLKAAASSAWLELQYEGEALIPNLREQLLAAVEGSELDILRIRNNRIYDFVLQQTQETESLDDLSVTEVFERCLENGRIEDTQRQQLRGAFAEIMATIGQKENEGEAML
jgi:exonuclease SbcD